MDFVSEGVKTFFHYFIGGIKRQIDDWWDRKTGEKLPDLEFNNLEDLVKAIENKEIAGEQTVKIENVCVSNFAPLYLCYQDSYKEINRTIQEDASKAADLYNSLKEKHGLDDSISLFLEAAKGRIRIDSMFRQYVYDKKFRFLGLSLARFAPITEKMCYGALFNAGKQLCNYIPLH